MKWEKTITAVKKTRLKSPKTVALIGLAHLEHEPVHFERRNLEFWSCNESYSSGFIATPDGDFRTDRWFQIHKQEDFSRLRNSNDARHYEWLQQEHNFPIYMQEKFKEIPNAKKLPLKKLEKMFFSNLNSTKVDGTPVPWLEEHEHGFFTSSFSYMMAMAIAEGFKAIEIWGFAMGSQSEYAQQATGGTFWISAAMNRGIDVTVSGKSPLLHLPLYGYDYGACILPSEVKDRLEKLKEDLPSYEKAAAEAGEERVELETRTVKAFIVDELLGEELSGQLHEKMQSELQLGGRLSFQMGAQYECRLYLNTIGGDSDKGWLDRISLEFRHKELTDEVNHIKEDLLTVQGAKAEAKLTLINENLDAETTDHMATRGLDLLAKEIYLSNELNYVLGSRTQCKWFLLNIDMRQPNQIDEKEFGQLWIAELFPRITDVLGDLEEHNGA